MRSIDSAMHDVSARYSGITYDVETNSPLQWTLTVWNERVPGSYLKIEISDVGGIPAALVLERRSLGYRSMSRFMNRLMNALDSD